MTCCDPRHVSSVGGGTSFATKVLAPLSGLMIVTWFKLVYDSSLKRTHREQMIPGGIQSAYSPGTDPKAGLYLFFAAPHVSAAICAAAFGAMGRPTVMADFYMSAWLISVTVVDLAKHTFSRKRPCWSHPYNMTVLLLLAVVATTPRIPALLALARPCRHARPHALCRQVRLSRRAVKPCAESRRYARGVCASVAVCTCVCMGVCVHACVCVCVLMCSHVPLLP
jgi:hypothetical protein